MPAGAGMRRHEEPELWLGTSNRHGGFSRAPPRPQRGTSPLPRVVFDRATFSRCANDHRSRIRDVWPVESRDRGWMEGTSRIGVRDVLAYQSLMPDGAGTRRYEKPKLRFYAANSHGGFCHAQARPQRGTSPRATFSRCANDHRSTIRDAASVESRDRGWKEGTSRIGIRDVLAYRMLMPAGAGTLRYENPELGFFAANSHGGFCRAHPDPSGGQAPALHFLVAPTTIGLGFGTFGRWRAGDRGWKEGTFPIPAPHVPDRNPGCACLPNANAGWGRHTKI